MKKPIFLPLFLLDAILVSSKIKQQNPAMDHYQQSPTM
jgi:hypothetical protein